MYFLEENENSFASSNKDFVFETWIENSIIHEVK